MSQDDTLKLFLKNKVKDVSTESISLVESISEFKSYHKGEVILDYGEFNDDTFVIKSGFVANFSRQEDGSDFIRTLFKADDEFGSLRCGIKGEKSNVAFKALTDCEVYQLSSKQLLKERNPFIVELYISILENTFFKFEKRIGELSGFDATKRYLQLRKDIPYIDNILPQYQIANYINITPVQLSRIRRKIINK